VSEKHSPLEQFVIVPKKEIFLGSYDVSFTNSSLFMLLAVISVIIFLGLGIRGRALVPNRWQSMVELSYLFVANQMREIVGNEGQKFFPLVFTIFMFVLFGNLLGMLPYSFTFTSHIIVTFALACFIFIGITLLALAMHGLKFFKFFLPEGTPIYIAPVIVVIEVFSYLSRPISLSIRLAANIMAGHILLKVVGGFVIALGAWVSVTGVVPIAFLVILTGFEFFVAFLQAYIFTVLTCLYLNDAIHLH
jgi:F-type H+-transporting ATPase subunit a